MSESFVYTCAALIVFGAMLIVQLTFRRPPDPVLPVPKKVASQAKAKSDENAPLVVHRFDGKIPKGCTLVHSFDGYNTITERLECPTP